MLHHCPSSEIVHSVVFSGTQIPHRRALGVGLPKSSSFESESDSQCCRMKYSFASVGEIAGKSHLLNMRGLVDSDEVVLVVGIRAESRGFRDDNRVAVLGPWLHRNGATLSWFLSDFFWEARCEKKAEFILEMRI